MSFYHRIILKFHFLCVSPGDVEEQTKPDRAESEQIAEESEDSKKATSLCCSEEINKEKEKNMLPCLSRRESSASSEDSVISPDKVGMVFQTRVSVSPLRGVGLVIGSLSLSWDYVR